VTRDEGRKVVARNRRATHDFEILEKVEAGLVLAGSEVKALRDGKASIAEAWARFDGDELWLIDAHIPEYRDAGYSQHDPKRRRKLLLHRRAPRKLEQTTTRKGLTMVPLQVYFRNGRAKVEIALARGRKRHDKREDLRGKAARREVREAEGRR